MIRASFIGIDRYADPLIRDLTGATRDALALWAVLNDSIPNIHSTLLVDAQASMAAVTDALDATLGAASADDVVILGFAGHGTADHRLVLSDSSIEDLPGTTIGMDDLAGRFRQTRAKVVIMFLDCCFSGGAPARVINFGLVPRGPVIPMNEIAGKGRILFAASGADQAALEDPQTRHGLFTKAILDCLLIGQPVSVLGMVDAVTRNVRASAERLGYEQTPAMFGMVEGELSLPACRRGAHYTAAFPEFAAIQTTGDFLELASYGLPVDILQTWRERYPTGLNALQTRAINEFNVLGGNSLLTVAPTSAGKTFIGELAAIKAIAEGRKAVFLLPFKALVNEKFEDFSALYGDRLNLRVARCSGDWQDQVGTVVQGKYDLAFFTYEKFLAMATAMPHILNQIGLVVLDEAQFITEAGRGMAVELILTHLISARQRGVAPQLLALSAVIGHVNGFECWLGADLLISNARPVPLTEGVIDRSGQWTFLHDRDIRSEEMVDRGRIRQRRQTPSSQDILVPLVQALVARNERVIVFRNSRGAAKGCAHYLAAELGLPPATDVIANLPDGDPSVMTTALRGALQGGVAFHHGDLTREERVAVERGFRQPDGGLRVLVATSTVAAGVNTPASTVIVVETAFRGAGGDTPYSVAQYKNMAGRAGRLGYEEQGKSILIADTAMERNTLFRRYVQGEPEPLRSSFDERNPGTWVLRLLAQVPSVERAGVTRLIANTYGGFLASEHDPRFTGRMQQILDQLLDRMVADGLVEDEQGILRLTMLGRACGTSALSLESCLRLIEALRRVPLPLTPAMIGVLIEILAERDLDYTPQTRGGEARWQMEARNTYGADMTGILSTRAREQREFYARCKRALIVTDWIRGVPTGDIERRFTANAFAPVGHGDIRGFADGVRLLVEAAIKITSIVRETAFDEGEVENYLRCLDLGVPAAVLPLTRLGVPVTRGTLLRLHGLGIHSPEALYAQGRDQAEHLLGEGGIPLYEAVALAAAG